MSVERIGQILNSRTPRSLQAQELKPAAVLVPLQERQDGDHLVLTRRAAHLNHHQGQIAFPGGKVEILDPSALETALRESREEVGIDPQDVRLLGQLDQVVAGYNFVITPFVGAIPHPYEFRLNLDEASEVFTVPVRELLHEGRFKIEPRAATSIRRDPIYHFYYDDRDIWGATAKILAQFLELAYDFKAQ